MDQLLTTDNLVALLTLSVMEIVLGVDNVIFIAILVGKLPAAQQETARRLGLTLALGIRIGLLLMISWVMGLTQPLFTLFGHGFSGRDLILLGGGLFLIGKSTWEIYDKLEADHEGGSHDAGSRGAFIGVLIQILLLDIVFSLDSVITAVGMADSIPIMVAAMTIAMVVMLASAGAVGGFVERHPSVKILALSFLLLIGAMLVAEGTGAHVGKGYIYASMAFAVFVELLNMRLRKKRAPVSLHNRFEGNQGEGALPAAQDVRSNAGGQGNIPGAAAG
jgi:predicted tellurium resistance membrane protein TerC